MDDITSGVFWLGYHTLMFVTLACILGALPPLITGASLRRQPRRFLAAVTAGYVLAAVTLGFYSYFFVPSQYIRDFDFGKHDGWSLGESHSDSLRKADTPDAGLAEEASRSRARVERERREFVGTWAIVAAGGFAITLGGVGATWLLVRRSGWGAAGRAPSVRGG